MPAGYAVQGEPAGSAGDLTGQASALLKEGQWLLSLASNEGMSTKAELFVWYKPPGRTQVGVAFLAKPEAARFLFNYEGVSQQGARPSLTVGVGFQEVGTGNPGVFATASWTLTHWLGTPSSLYLGAGRRLTTRGESLDPHWLPVGGLSVQVARDLSATVQMDGRQWHGVLSVRVGELRIGLFALGFQHLGVMVGWRSSK